MTESLSRASRPKINNRATTLSGLPENKTLSTSAKAWTWTTILAQHFQEQDQSVQLTL